MRTGATLFEYIQYPLKHTFFSKLEVFKVNHAVAYFFKLSGKIPLYY